MANFLDKAGLTYFWGKVKTLLNGKVSKSGDTITGVLSTNSNINFNTKNRGFYGLDSTSFSYPYLRDNGTNLWMGANATKAQHHTGGLYLSAGWNPTTKTGYPSIFVSVPNAANDNATNYEVWNKGNLTQATLDSFVKWSELPDESGVITVEEWGNADFSYEEGHAAYSTVAGNTQEPRASKFGRVVNLTGAYKTTVAHDSTAAFTMGKVPPGCEPLHDVRVRQQGTGQNSYLLVIDTAGNLKGERYGVATNTAIPNNVWLNINVTYISKS